MPTIAELQINIDSRPIEQATKGLNDFASAADRASKAGKSNQQMNEQASSSTEKAAKSEENLSAMIDAQTRKLEQLGQQRRKLEQSGMKNTMPAEYERLNRIIDANIGLVVRQGNAVDSLNAKQTRDTAKKEAAYTAELRLQERIVAASERRENIVSRAAASEQRQIDQTINGLSKQIKAQNEYNQSIEILNRARALGNNGSMGKDGGISAGEYDSYVKLAQARRDAALASEDNTRAIQQAQNKLDTYTATLGKVERAEVQYSRAVRVLDENLNRGNITLEQYNSQLSRFSSHRDKAIASTNDNTQAEARFARELQSVLSAYDPVIRAQDQYNASVKILSQGLQSGVISAEQFNKSLTEQRQALDGVKTAQSGVKDMGGEYDSALNSLVPYRAELRNLEQQEKVLKAQKEAGKVVTQQQITEYNQATQAIERNREALNKRIASGQGASLSYKQEMAALRGMPAQITDIVVSLQGGQAPLTVLLQQGGQIKDMFGGIVPALRGMSTALLAMVNPATIVGAGFVALASGAYAGSQEITAFNRAMIQSGNASGISAGQFSLLRNELDATTTTAGKAAEALTLIEKSGRIAGDMFKSVAEAAVLMEKATGQAMSKTIEDFTAIGKDPVDAAVRLDEQYRFLTASVLTQADALVKQGRETEAVTLLQGQLSTAATETATLMIEQAGYIEQAWLGVKNVVSETWDALKNIGRDDTTGDRMLALVKRQGELQTKIGLNEKLFGGFGIQPAKDELADTEKQIKQLQQRMDIEKFGAEQTAKTERERREAVSAQASANKRYESSMKGVEKAENDLKKVRLENSKIVAGGNVSDEQRVIMVANEARAVKELADAKEKANKPKNTPVDTTSVQEVKSNLAMIEAEYDGYYKRVTALGEANIVSDEATYQSQRAILEKQREAVSASYDSQISAIKTLRDNKKNSTAQNISLDNQLTKSEAARVVSLEKIDTKLDTLKTKERGRLEERTRNVASYKAALDAQLESLREEGARATDGVGRGDNAAAIAKQLAENDRSFDKQQRQLSKSLSDGMDPSEYADKLRDLKDTHTEMTEQILKNNDDIQTANSDWTNGFTKAVENAGEEGRNFAKSTNSAVSGAFSSMGDALADFVTTGKLDFRSLALSIIADMAKIAARQAASSALSSLFGMAASAAGSYFGGSGANGLAAGSAGATSSATGATQGGYSSTYFPQAKGGAWDNGTKFYALGGAFTNSIVSSPTAFSTAGGGKGVMGEAGPEAIIPLSRASDGSLGVKMTGGGDNTGGGVNVYVTISDNGAETQTDEASYKGFGKEIGDFVDSRYRTLMDRDLRAGGNLRRAINEK